MEYQSLYNPNSENIICFSPDLKYFLAYKNNMFHVYSSEDNSIVDSQRLRDPRSNLIFYNDKIYFASSFKNRILKCWDIINKTINDVIELNDSYNVALTAANDTIFILQDSIEDRSTYHLYALRLNKPPELKHRIIDSIYPNREVLQIFYTMRSWDPSSLTKSTFNTVFNAKAFKDSTTLIIFDTLIVNFSKKHLFIKYSIDIPHDLSNIMFTDRKREFVATDNSREEDSLKRKNKPILLSIIHANLLKVTYKEDLDCNFSDNYLATVGDQLILLSGNTLLKGPIRPKLSNFDQMLITFKAVTYKILGLTKLYTKTISQLNAFEEISLSKSFLNKANLRDAQYETNGLVVNSLNYKEFTLFNYDTSNYNSIFSKDLNTINLHTEIEVPGITYSLPYIENDIIRFKKGNSLLKYELKKGTYDNTKYYNGLTYREYMFKPQLFNNHIFNIEESYNIFDTTSFFNQLRNDIKPITTIEAFNVKTNQLKAIEGSCIYFNSNYLNTIIQSNDLFNILTYDKDLNIISNVSINHHAHNGLSTLEFLLTDSSVEDYVLLSSNLRGKVLDLYVINISTNTINTFTIDKDISLLSCSQNARNLYILYQDENKEVKSLQIIKRTMKLDKPLSLEDIELQDKFNNTLRHTKQGLVLTTSEGSFKVKDISKYHKVFNFKYLDKRLYISNHSIVLSTKNFERISTKVKTKRKLISI